jgi:anti-sigma regulatory factor (Ser/Thr protein kinase)
MGPEDTAPEQQPLPTDESEVPPQEGEGEAIIGATLDSLRRATATVDIERHLAETLQQNLLPSLPVVPGLRFAAQYRPGAAETQVGGDWYDAIPLRSGNVAIVIGDVVGRGVEAAARMAHLQSAVRVYALESLRPAIVLERMNGFVFEGEQGGMVTLLYAIVDPGAGTMRLASAGHPPPLLLRPDEEPSFAETPPASPLGVTRFPLYEESVTTLDPEATLLFYTDGLVEGPGLPLVEGLEQLRRASSGRDLDPESLCSSVLSSIGPGSRDDVALLAVAVDPPGEILDLSLSGRPGSLASMRHALGNWLRAGDAHEDEVYEVLVACGEACANAIGHAHPATSDQPFELRAVRSRSEVEITIRDTGRWRPPTDEPIGRGMTLMRELMDDVDIRPKSSGTTVTMRRRLRGAAAREGSR